MIIAELSAGASAHDAGDSDDGIGLAVLGASFALVVLVHQLEGNVR